MIPFFTAALAGNFILTVIAARILIPKLKSMKLGQKILDIGPRWHKSKEGTPTMGGLSFIFASLITAVIMSVVMVATDNSDGLPKLIIVLLGAAANGAVGVIDDLTKFHNHRNEGLTATQKYLLQLAAAAAFLAAMKLTGNLTTELLYSVCREVGRHRDILLYYITDTDNRRRQQRQPDRRHRRARELGHACRGGFLRGGGVHARRASGGCACRDDYRRVPRVSRLQLLSGAGVHGGHRVAVPRRACRRDGVHDREPLIIIVVGIVYICEAASVILQVGYFKLTHGKRLFKMAPDTSPFREVRLERDKDRRRLLADNPDRGSHISSRSVKKL